MNAEWYEVERLHPVTGKWAGLPVGKSARKSATVEMARMVAVHWSCGRTTRIVRVHADGRREVVS